MVLLQFNEQGCLLLHLRSLLIPRSSVFVYAALQNNKCAVRNEGQCTIHFNENNDCSFRPMKKFFWLKVDERIGTKKKHFFFFFFASIYHPYANVNDKGMFFASGNVLIQPNDLPQFSLERINSALTRVVR